MKVLHFTKLDSLKHCQAHSSKFTATGTIKVMQYTSKTVHMETGTGTKIITKLQAKVQRTQNFRIPVPTIFFPKLK